MRVHEYLRILVIDSKIVDYEYFMDDITDWEIAMLLKMSHEAHRNDWEIARYVSYNNAMVSGNLKKQYAEKPITELFPLPYDERNEHKDIEISNKAVEVLTVRANKMAEKLKNMKKK